MAATGLTIGALLPLVGFVVLVFFGRRLGEPRAGILASGLMVLAAVISIAVTVHWLGLEPGERGVEELSFHWLTIGDRAMYVGSRVDSLTVVMFTMVAVVSSAIFIYSIGYMHGDSRFPRFFTYLSLFGFSMLGLVLANSLILLFVFWELVGVCSYFLIGFWFERRRASDAAKKAFIVCRVGDCLFAVGLAAVFGATGQLELSGVIGSVAGGSFSGGHGLLTFAGICLFFGAVGKSAQFPLHVWLPDAMEGPTPVSALIHAATMVAAGVYLVGRIFPILTAEALIFVGYIGAITLFGSALIAIVLTDMKRVLAYSTISQLGYMILSLGVGGWVAGLFHLITHACFKALLFLGSGSVIHGCGDEQDVRRMGGLHRKMRITSYTFLVATLAISGFPFFSGFYSKDAILASALRFSYFHGHWLLFILPMLAAGITAFYMMRLYILTFRGRPRDAHIYTHAHESPAVMTVPLVFLAVLSLCVGWGSVVPSGHGGGASVGAGLAGVIAEASPVWAKSFESLEPKVEGEHVEGEHGEGGDDVAGDHDVHEKLHHIVTFLAIGMMGAGIVLGVLMYGFGYPSPERAGELLGPVYRLVVNKFYFDELYRATFVAGALKLASFGRWFDLTVLDGIADGSARRVASSARFSGEVLDNRGVDGAVNGMGSLAFAGGRVVRSGQTGVVRNYVLGVLSVAALVILVLMLI